MKRTTALPSTVQPGLFDSVDVHTLADDNARLQAQVARLKNENRRWERCSQRLKAERDQISQAGLNDPAHPLHQECQRLRHEVAGLRATLRQHLERRGALEPGHLNTEVLTKLLVLAHPDTWQGQPAEVLAHELTVCINALRQGATA